jgi:hypothetical protein
MSLFSILVIINDRQESKWSVIQGFGYLFLSKFENGSLEDA